jgi:hypothetical protein
MPAKKKRRETYSPKGPYPEFISLGSEDKLQPGDWAAAAPYKVDPIVTGLEVRRYPRRYIYLRPLVWKTLKG